jgi:hypothetical protein
MRGGRRYAPYAFTEQGIAMLSSVLHSARAVQVNVPIMRTFVRLREMLRTHEELRRKIDAMEKRYDARFQTFSRLFGRCWKHRFRLKIRSDSMQESSFRRTPPRPKKQL